MEVLSSSIFLNQIQKTTFSEKYRKEVPVLKEFAYHVNEGYENEKTMKREILILKNNFYYNSSNVISNLKKIIEKLEILHAEVESLRQKIIGTNQNIFVTLKTCDERQTELQLCEKAYDEKIIKFAEKRERLQISDEAIEKIFREGDRERARCNDEYSCFYYYNIFFIAANAAFFYFKLTEINKWLCSVRCIFDGVAWISFFEWKRALKGNQGMIVYYAWSKAEFELFQKERKLINEKCSEVTKLQENEIQKRKIFEKIIEIISRIQIHIRDLQDIVGRIIVIMDINESIMEAPERIAANKKKIFEENFQQSMSDFEKQQNQNSFNNFSQIGKLIHSLEGNDTLFNSLIRPIEEEETKRKETRARKIKDRVVSVIKECNIFDTQDETVIDQCVSQYRLEDDDLTFPHV